MEGANDKLSPEVEDRWVTGSSWGQAITNTHPRYKESNMATSLQQKTREELMRVRTALENYDNSISSEEIIFVHTCCQILKIDSKNRMILIADTVMDEDRGDPPKPSLR